MKFLVGELEVAAYILVWQLEVATEYTRSTVSALRVKFEHATNSRHCFYKETYAPSRTECCDFGDWHPLDGILGCNDPHSL